MSHEAASTAPPSRWLLVVTVLVVLAFTVGRVWLAATLDFRSDEAYYWTWSHQAVLSYLDHPPMVAWFERLGQAIFGDTTLGARFGQILALPLIELLLADVARRRTGSWNAALFVVLMLECTMYYGLVVAILEPSIPLLLFASLLLWALCRLDESGDGRWWLLVGAAGGLALLSKYIALLLVPALLVYLVLRRRWLATAWPYAAALGAVVIFSPVLAWNAGHGWASFAYQSTRLGAGHAPGIGDLWRFFLYDSLSAGLLLVPAVIVGAIVLAVRRPKAFEAAVAAAFLLPLAFFVVRSLSLQINQSWAYFVWPMGVLALALALPWETAPRRIAALAGVVALPGALLVGAFFHHAIADTAVWGGKGDPFGQDAGFGEMADKVLAEARTSGATWIATSEYRTYANLLWHIGTQIPVLMISERARFLDFAPRDPGEFTGTALYAHLGPASPLVAKAASGPSQAIPIAWRGTVMGRMTVETLAGFTPELNPAPGSPAYAWAPQ